MSKCLSHEKRTALKVGHVGSETWSLAYYFKVKIPEFLNFTSKSYVKVFQELYLPSQMMDLIHVWHDR